MRDSRYLDACRAAFMRTRPFNLMDATRADRRANFQWNDRPPAFRSLNYVIRAASCKLYASLSSIGMKFWNFSIFRSIFFFPFYACLKTCAIEELYKVWILGEMELVFNFIRVGDRNIIEKIELTRNWHYIFSERFVDYFEKFLITRKLSKLNSIQLNKIKHMK